MGSPFLWARGGELNLSSFKLKLKPLLIGATYVYPELRHDFYIDEASTVLFMHEPNCDNTWIASLSSNLDSIVNDRADVQQINPRWHLFTDRPARALCAPNVAALPAC
jgi:hypothetical protein